MLKKKWLRVVGGVVLGGGSMAAAALYTWIGGAAGNWSDETQWTATVGLCSVDCYPKTTDDDAVVGTEGVIVTLTESVTIDDLTFSGDGASAMTVKSDGATVIRVTTDSIVIDGTSVQLTDLAAMKAQGTNPCS